MKHLLAALTALLAVLSSSYVFAQFGTNAAEGDPTPGFGRPMIDLYAAGVAGSRARGSSSMFTDIETTAMTRFEEKMENELAAVRTARAAVQEITYALPVNQAEIQRRINALAAAELALALRRADEFPALSRQLQLSDPSRMANFLPQMR